MKIRKLTPLVMGVVVALVASMAQADHTQVTFTLSDSSAGANSDADVDVDYGTDQPDTGSTHLAEGFLVAHADDNTSPLSPPPQNGDIVGEGTSTAKWKLTFCSRQTLTFESKWVEPVDIDAPSGAVGQINHSTSLGFTVKSYVVKVGSGGDSYVSGAHYDLVVPAFGDNACSGSNVTTSITTYGTVPGSSPTRYVGQNPGTAGDYDIWSVYTDKSGIDHETMVTVTIT